MEHLRDDELAAVIARVPGVRVTHHYQGERVDDAYYVHLAVEDDAALYLLCELSARANAPLQVYARSASEFRYTLIVNAYSREILLSDA